MLTRATRLLLLVALTAFLAKADIVYPGSQGSPAADAGALDLNNTNTDAETIASTALQVDQKSGATSDAPPGLPAADTTVTAVDGTLVNQNITSATRRSISTTTHLGRRNNSNYELVFWGTGTGLDDRDASVDGTAYLTYTLVNNATYDIDDCLAFCDSVEGCVFANLYYEFNNELLDFVFSEKSNLKCALYGDVHSAEEKTNFGGQQLESPPAGLDYIQQSSGWAAKSLVDPATPPGYEPVFGPLDGANNAPGYMGFAFIDQYDVQACADLCNTRGADSAGGGCQFFNIWRALVNGIPTTYTCAMYFIPTDASTAVNYGQGDLKVTESRGYRRKSFVADGGFEGYTCDTNVTVPFCFTTGYSAWQGTTPIGGHVDASIIHYTPYAHSGSSVGLLGSAFGEDDFAGTLAPTQPLATEKGATYSIQFFLSSTFTGEEGEANAYVMVYWNGITIATITPGFSPWTFYQYQVVAKGNDVLEFHGGNAPALSFIDDVYVFLV